MSLEDILKSLHKPVQWLDEQILRHYTKLARKYESNGGDIYFLSAELDSYGQFCGITGMGGSIFFYNFDLYQPILVLLSRIIGGVIGWKGIDLLSYPDRQLNRLGIRGYLDDKLDSAIAVDPNVHQYKSFNKHVRLYVFLAGVGFLAKSVYEYYNLSNFISYDFVEGGMNLFAGCGLICMASSMYLKDRDPKLLDKMPVWKRVYEAVKNKVEGLIPEPTPPLQPVPIARQT